MAVRVQNGEVLNFGVFGAAATVTHARVGFGSTTLATAALGSERSVSSGSSLEFAVGDIDLVFPSGALEDAGLSGLLALYFAQDVWVDLMTDASTVVAVSGYAQQTSSVWSRSVESD